MRRNSLIFILVLLVFVIEQGIMYSMEPKVIEALPVQFSETPEIDPEFPEPVQVVFDKPITINSIEFTVVPYAALEPTIKERVLRHVPKIESSTRHPAYVLENSKSLSPHTEYTVTLSKKGFNIFRLIIERPLVFQFRTTEKISLPKETGDDIEKRLLRQ